MFYTYVLLCEDGSYYKAFTNNLEYRYQQYINGNGVRFTAKHKPVKIAYYETFKTNRKQLKEKNTSSLILVMNG